LTQAKPDPKRLLRQLDPADLAGDAHSPSTLGSDLPGRPTYPAMQPGLRLGDRFVVVRRLGQGAMGLVVEALDEVTGRPVALKLILERRDSEKLRARLQREAELTARVAHPGVLKIHDVAEHEGRPFLVYELVPAARPFSQALPELGLEARLGILERVAEGLGAAHAVGVIHRDLKPENVLLTAQNEPRVVDFGLALDLGGERLTQTGTLLGSPCYMAPEQVTGKRDRVGPATDVWALGVMLFELVTDSLPFQGTTLMELAAQICSDRRLTLRSRSVNAPPALEAVVRRALSADESQRFADGAAFAAALRAARGSGSSPMKRAVGILLASLLVCGVSLAVSLGGRPAMPVDDAASRPDPAVAVPPEPAAVKPPPDAEPLPKPPRAFALPKPPSEPLSLPWEHTFSEPEGAFFLDETYLVVVMKEKLVHVDLRKGTVVHEVKLPSSFEGVVGRALRFKRQVLVADATWRTLTRAAGSGLLGSVGAAVLDPPGERLAYSVHSVGSVVVLGETPATLPQFLHVAKIKRLALGSSHLVACSGKAVSWWNVETRKKIGFVDSIDAEDVAIDPRAQTVLVGDEDGRVLCFDLKTSEKLRLYLPQDDRSAGTRSLAERVARVEFLTDGARLFSVARRKKSRRLFSVAEQSSRAPSAALWSRDGTSLWESPATEWGFSHFAVSPSEAHVALTNSQTGSVQVLRLPPRAPQ
jgi:serine/threonine protein kinase